MYLIQLNPTPRDGKIYVMYSTVIKKKEKGGDQKRYGHILIKKKKRNVEGRGRTSGFPMLRLWEKGDDRGSQTLLATC